MCTFILKSYNQKREIEKPHFFILNKGNNSGKPLLNPCPNCFVIQFQCEEEKEQIYWLLYSLWQSKAFYPYLRGSVIPFIVIRDVKECLSDGLEKVEANPIQFEKAVAALRSLEDMEKIQKKPKTYPGCKAYAYLQIFMIYGQKNASPPGGITTERLPHHIKTVDF